MRDSILQFLFFTMLCYNIILQSQRLETNLIDYLGEKIIHLYVRIQRSWLSQGHGTSVSLPSRRPSGLYSSRSFHAPPVTSKNSPSDATISIWWKTYLHDNINNAPQCDMCLNNLRAMVFLSISNLEAVNSIPHLLKYVPVPFQLCSFSNELPQAWLF